jgi:hypothetical protein
LSYRWVQAEQRTNGRGRCYSKIRHPQPLLFRPLRFVASDQPRRDCSRRSGRVSSGKDLPKKGNLRRVSVHHAVNRPWGLRGRPPSGPSAGVVHNAITRRVREAAISLGEVHCVARAGIEGRADYQRSEKGCQPGHVPHSIRDVPEETYEFRRTISRMLLRLSGCACPNVIRGPVGWLARVPWMDGCRTTIATTPYKKGDCGSVTIIVSNSPALCRRSALASTRNPQSASPPETLRSLSHRMVATPTGHLSRQRIAVGSFLSECFPWVWLLSSGQTPSPRSPAPLGAISMSILGALAVSADRHVRG